jgi:hypothetical protein
LLTYGNNKYRQIIYIRQGEEDDYLMRPEDESNSSGFQSSNRPYAVKFSPYNLTAPDGYHNETLINTYGTPQEGSISATFTHYPTQAGAYFTWDNILHPRYALAPITPIADWDNDINDYYWDVVSGNAETCPYGYRRPEDGTTSALNSAGLVAGSEIRQSLWLNPLASYLQVPAKLNNTYGYYADGFFDRREIETPSHYSYSDFDPLSAVSAADDSIAYAGSLFFNPANHASLFFPSAGFSNGTSNNYAGRFAIFSTTSIFMQNPFYMWTLYLGQDKGKSSVMFFLPANTAKSVRCIVEPLMVIPKSLTFDCNRSS